MENLFQVRKRLHKIPEPAFQEIKTTRFILEYLQGFSNITCHTFDFPGVLVEYSRGEGDYLLFRADMDALPIEEKTGCDFASEHPGYMHACGHDIHMTILLGLIEHVTVSNLKKNLLFLFQPAEEGHGGAERVIATGILDKFNIKEAYALHVHPGFPAGTIASNPGVLMGIPQEFDIIFKGKSSHAAHPHKGNDAIATACNYYHLLRDNLQKAVPPEEMYIFHIGKISGGSARNIVSDMCILQGTLRALTKETMEILKTQTVETAKMVAALNKTEPKVKFLTSYDPVVNSARLFEKLKKILAPDLHLEEVSAVLLGEDFGFFTTRYEGLMFWIGTGTPETDLHSPNFLPAESSIVTGVKTFIALLETDY